MASRIIGWLKGSSLLQKFIVVLAVIAVAAIAVVLLRGPAPPPEVPYP